MEIKQPEKEVVIAVIAGIVILEVCALLKGIDGVLLTTVIAILAALGGLVLPQLKVK